jgi:Myb-like DNA-binding domain
VVHSSKLTRQTRNSLASTTCPHSSNALITPSRSSTQEDEALKRAVEEQHNRNGGQAVTTIDWVVVATQAGLERHTNMQCRFRWNNNFRPGLKKGDWTLQEHEAIRQMYQTMGPKYVFSHGCSSLCLLLFFCHHYLIDTRLFCLDYGNNSNV